MKKLKRNLEDLFKAGINFIENLKDKENLVLIYDSDADGITSAALVLFVLKKMGKNVVKTIPSFWGNIERIKRELKNFDKIITVDVPIDLIEKNLIEMKKEMLVIDHHPGRDLNSEKIVLVNPRLENNKVYQPTSYVVYKMFSNFLKDKRWLAVLGTVGDFGVDDCKDLVRIKNKKNIWKSKFGRAAAVLTSSASVLGAERVLKILMKSRNLGDFINNEEISNASEKFEKELKRCEKEFERNQEIYGKILISKIKPKYRGICSALITNYSTQNPEKIVFIFEEDGKEVKIHGRCGSKEVDIGELLRKIGIGGGHEAAGAGRIDKKEENKVKNVILRKLKSFTR
ncbi:MAG: DHHA1 domain-containing protein [Candidatus Aenigmatarchaeota archaeon]